MFARSSAFTSFSRRKVNISGEQEVDYSFAGAQAVIKLHTADKEQVKKGGWTTIELVSKVTTHKNILFVQPHEDLVNSAVITGTQLIDKEDTGRIVFHLKPNQDIDLLALPYICRIYIEREAV